jgi:hypothetical protein
MGHKAVTASDLAVYDRRDLLTVGPMGPVGRR